ncbi:MAG: hypothetical protein ACTHLO_19335 [Pseudolabrys sp.]
MRHAIFKIVGVLTVAAIAFGAGRIYRPSAATPKPRWTLATALPFGTVGSLSAHSRARVCVEANPPEHEILDKAAALYEEAGADGNLQTLRIGLEKFFGRDLYRGPLGDVVAVCPPDDVYRRLAAPLSEGGLNYRWTEYNLSLASKLPNPSPAIVDAVARSAFNAQPQESEVFKLQDLRPQARMVLATFGRGASAYSDQAYSQMSADDSMGTGAAQIAAATGHNGALDRIKSMMEKILASVPRDKPIPHDTKLRLYELSYAIFFAGAGAEDYVAPINELMRRKVASWAPPFGMVEHTPTRLCELVARIEGQSALQDYPFCTDPKRVLDN